MGTVVKKTEIRLTANPDGVKKGYKEVESRTGALEKKLTSQFKKIGSRIAGALGAAAMGKFFIDSARLAIDAEETFSKFGVVFSKTMDKASKSAKNLQDNYGLSELASKGLLASTGDLLKGFGAEETQALALSSRVQELSADLSSFQNLQGGAARASEIITKAMLGERDSLIALGVKVSDLDVKTRLLQLGQQDLTGQTLLVAKAEATLALITEQSGNAIGDYARTSTSAANTLKRLGNTFEDFQVTVGKSIVENKAFSDALTEVENILTDPAIIDAISSIAGALLSGFSALIPVVSTAIQLISGIINVLSDLKDVIIPLGIAVAATFAIGKIAAWATGFTVLSGTIAASNVSLAAYVALSKAASIASAALSAAIPFAAIAAIVAATYAYVKLQQELVDVTNKVIDAEMRHNDVMQTTTERFRDFRDFAQISSEKLQKMTADFAHIEDRGIRFNKIMRAIRDGNYGPELAKQFDEWKKSTGGVAGETRKLNDAAIKSALLTKAQIKEIKNAQKAYDKLSDSIGVLSEGTLKKLNTEAASLNKIFQENKAKFQDNSRESELFKKTLDKLIDSFGGLWDAPPVLQAINKEFEKLNPGPIEEFAEFAEGLNADILPELGGEIRNVGNESEKTKEEIKKLNDELAKKVASDAADRLSELTNIFVQVADGAIGLAGKLGILSDDGQESFGNLVNTISSGSKTFTSIMTGDIVGAITGAMETIGSFVDLLGSVFGGESGEMEAAKRNLLGITGLTQDWTAEIEKLAKEIGGAGSAEKAFAQLLPGIIADSENTVENFKELVDATHDIIATWRWAGGELSEVQENFGAAFDALIVKSKEMGLEGGSEIMGLISQYKELGWEIKGISEYIESNMINATSGWVKVMDQFGGVSISILDEQVRLMKLAESVLPGTKSLIEGATEALIGLSNAGQLNQDEFAQFGIIVQDVQQKLKDQGIVGADAAVQMEDLLERLIFLSSEYGLEIDTETQLLIDQGIESGKLSSDIRSDTQKQLDIGDRQIELMEALLGYFGVKIPGAMDDMGKAAERMAGKITRDLGGMQDGLSDVADTIHDDVIGAFEDLGEANDDIMWRNSIIPDIEEWEKKNHEVSEQMKNEVSRAIAAMGDEYAEVQEGIEANPLFDAESISEFKDKFSEAFEAIKRDSQTGSRALTDMMDAANKLGFGKDVEAFKTEKLNESLASFSNIKAIGGIDTTKLRKEIWLLERDIGKLNPDSIKYSDAIKELDVLKDKLSDVTAAQKVFGDLSIAVLDDMFQYQEKVGKNQTLIDGIKDATDLLGSFSIAQGMESEEYQDFEDIALEAYKQLEGQGFKTNEIYETLAPMLERLDFLNKEFGMGIDESTQALIDEGRALGEVGEIQKTEQEQMIEGVGITNMLLEAMLKGMGIALPETVESMISSIPTEDTGMFDGGMGDKKTDGTIRGDHVVLPENLESDISNILFTLNGIATGDIDTTAIGGISTAAIEELIPDVITETVTAATGAGAGEAVTKTYHITMKITPTDAINPIALAEKLKVVFVENTNQVMDILEGELDD